VICRFRRCRCSVSRIDLSSSCICDDDNNDAANCDCSPLRSNALCNYQPRGMQHSHSLTVPTGAATEEEGEREREREREGERGRGGEADPGTARRSNNRSEDTKGEAKGRRAGRAMTAHICSRVPSLTHRFFPMRIGCILSLFIRCAFAALAPLRNPLRLPRHSTYLFVDISGFGDTVCSV